MRTLKLFVSVLSELFSLLILIYVVVWAPIVVGYKPQVIMNSSMEPSYKKGSISYYKKVPRDEIKVGDVITYKEKDNSTITHRITSIDNGVYTTKGDTNKEIDSYKITYKDIKGKNAKVIIRYVGYCISTINQFFIPFIITSIGIIVANRIINNKKTNKKKEKNKEEDQIEII